MKTLIVVSEPEDWSWSFPECEVTTAREYLTNPAYLERPRLRVVNLCRSHRYQKSGYYVSLMATARGHRPLPSLATIWELKSPTIVRLAGSELADQVDIDPRTDKSRITLDVFFGHDPRGEHPRLAAALYKRFVAPLLRATLVRNERRSGQWQLESVSLLRPDHIPKSNRDALGELARTYLVRSHPGSRKRTQAAYDLAILRDLEEAQPPSDALALQRFARAAEQVGLAVDFIDRRDFARLPQYDALFIRETTAVNHRTYRFAQRAAAEGLVVIDDPESILRCTNKVFLAEMLARYQIRSPPTAIVHRGNYKDVLQRLGTPCILKQPDSSFSQGVVKVSNADSYVEEVSRLLKRSELIVAQAFMPTDFDWRIGILNRQPIYACRYFMAARHWQIIKRGSDPTETAEGMSEAVSMDQVPPDVLDCALRAANLMGDGLYGVDLKEIDGRAYVIEVNDNPSIDGGYEDELLGKELYLTIMREFRRRLDARRGLPPTP